tara:strand:- start:2188 stop:2313 length:126 start_codon:yes stop_codon:yes gene_type:complete
MAKGLSFNHTAKKRTKRPGVHSKNASRGQNGYKKQYKGQGK